MNGPGNARRRYQDTKELTTTQVMRMTMRIIANMVDLFQFNCGLYGVFLERKQYISLGNDDQDTEASTLCPKLLRTRLLQNQSVRRPGLLPYRTPWFKSRRRKCNRPQLTVFGLAPRKVFSQPVSSHYGFLPLWAANGGRGAFAEAANTFCVRRP